MRIDTDTNPYIDNGYINRADYLEALCTEYPADVVHTLADLLGETEDFDGLVTMLEDYSETEADDADDADDAATGFREALAARNDARAAAAIARAAAAIGRAAALAPTIRTRAAAAQQYDAAAVRTARENLTGAYLEADAALNTALDALKDVRAVYAAARAALDAAD